MTEARLTSGTANYVLRHRPYHLPSAPRWCKNPDQQGRLGLWGLWSAFDRWRSTDL